MSKKSWTWNKSYDLIPAVVQNPATKDVLMLGYMNQESFNKTLETGFVTFFSRSKNRLWTKGESSGHFLKLKDWAVDCDDDTLLIWADPEGPTCHKGTTTCFDSSNTEMRSSSDVSSDQTVSDKTQNLSLDFLSQLERVIDERLDRKNTANSYVSKLVSEGEDRVIQKVGEEAVEVVIAAKGTDITEFKNEAADLLFHLMVLLKTKKISLSEISQLLEKRHQKS